METKKINTNQIIDKRYEKENSSHYASLFSLANGYMGIRASHEDLPIKKLPVSDGVSGTFVNGFYEIKPIVYGESAYGFADTGETIQNIANPLPLELRVNGELFDLDEVNDAGRLLEYERKLLLDEGILVRELVYETKSGNRVKVESSRLVSFTRRISSALKYKVTNLSDEELEIEIQSFINAETTNKAGGDDPRLAQGADKRVLEILSHDIDNLNINLLEKAPASELEIALSVSHKLDNATAHSISDKRIVFEKIVAPEADFGIEKHIAIVDQRHGDDILAEAIEQSNATAKLGFSVLHDEQVQYLEDFRVHSEVVVEGDDALQQALNFSMFHLLQSAPDDGLGSVSAKGISGEGYEGHYFWDTEMYVLPFFIYTKPEIAKSLLEYRYTTLDQARDRAKLMGQSRGAIFPWRTISGRELSAYYAAGSAQVHINGDIALAIAKYIDAWKDVDYLMEQGLEMLIETAIYYLEIGHHHKDKGFVINGVTGPDEYTTMVNNNYFTNLIVQINFANVLKFVDLLDAEEAGFTDKLFQGLGYEKTEILDEIQKAHDAMFFAYSEELGIPLQDDAFADREPWDVLGVPAENYPLLLNYHPMVIYSHRVSKQADMVFAQHLDPDRFTYDEHRKAYNYYELFTTHDSSLSVSMYSIMANYLGQGEKAYHYFMETSRLDLDNTHKNTMDGLHLANMAGNYAALTEGYAGMRVVDAELHFAPRMARNWDSYSIRINFQGNLVQVTVNQDDAKYELLEGQGLQVHHEGEVLNIDSITRTVSRPINKLELEDISREEIKTLVLSAKNVLVDENSDLLPGVEQRLQEFKELGYELIYLKDAETTLEKEFTQVVEDLGNLSNTTIVLTADETIAKQAKAYGHRVACLSYLAGDALSIGADFGVWSLDKLFPRDLQYL